MAIGIIQVTPMLTLMAPRASIDTLLQGGHVIGFKYIIPNDSVLSVRVEITVDHPDFKAPDGLTYIPVIDRYNPQDQMTSYVKRLACTSNEYNYTVEIINGYTTQS